jgi:F0F1-type ATP synthase assembly protein I
MEMLLPGLAGYWLDTKAGTPPVMMMVGFGAGMTLAIWHLLQLTKRDAGRDVSDKQTRPQDDRGDSN